MNIVEEKDSIKNRLINGKKPRCLDIRAVPSSKRLKPKTVAKISKRYRNSNES